jgi:aryl carrier-like protein
MAADVSEDHHRRWAQMGLEMITPQAGMGMLGELLKSGASPQIAAVPLVRTRLPQSVGPFYQELVVAAGSSMEQTAPECWLAELASVAPDARGEVLESRLGDQVRRVLALPAAQAVDRHETLLNLGMDSLMAMDLRNRVQAVVGVRVAVADLLQGISIAELARTVMQQLTFNQNEKVDVEGDDSTSGWEVGRI